MALHLNVCFLARLLLLLLQHDYLGSLTRLGKDRNKLGQSQH